MNSDVQQRLEAVLDRELEAADSLAATLDSERTALTGSSPQAVLDTAAEKTKLFGMIEALETERRALCDAASLTLPGLRALPASPPTGVVAGISARWRALLELIERCRLANDVNGYIIHVRRGQVGQLLQVLRGGAPLTYSAQGKTQPKSLRALARA